MSGGPPVTEMFWLIPGRAGRWADPTIVYLEKSWSARRSTLGSHSSEAVCGSTWPAIVLGGLKSCGKPVIRLKIAGMKGASFSSHFFFGRKENKEGDCGPSNQYLPLKRRRGAK